MSVKAKNPVNPQRAIVSWQKEDFYDEESLLKEMHRIFEICHGCRRCFNLCGVFPKLFDRIDAYGGDVSQLSLEDMDDIVSSCTLCDMCFAAKCPYVPPHPWNVDFPRLMLRYRAVRGRKTFFQRITHQLAKTDRNGCVATVCAGATNAVCQNSVSRFLMEKGLGIDRRAQLPPYRKGQLKNCPEEYVKPPNPNGLLYGQTVAVYLTCFMNYSVSFVAQAAFAVLAHHGLSVIPLYPGCCGMPLLEQGALKEVSDQAQHSAQQLRFALEDQGIKHLISLVPSCTLMLKSEWPDLLPGHPDILYVADHTWDLCSYMMHLVQNKVLMPDLQPYPGGIALHMACHVRAQNRGKQSQNLLSLLPDTPLVVIERCSGHGGLFGFQKAHFEEALRVGRPVFSAIEKGNVLTISSECPLALSHIKQGCQEKGCFLYAHPIEILARSYGIQTGR